MKRRSEKNEKGLWSHFSIESMVPNWFGMHIRRFWVPRGASLCAAALTEANICR